ncbi:MAG: 3-alpha,7-alpha, 12-alpha-trihydroxy-5-beta-cholest-24-enoyl-CoA hydratase [Verrucomicrobiaceae bacterium]|nr:3-alpha,7-alpha, 12-alpha-trihydroxy-5-beta-cholest-24-enoyl-CoA hydratase [Verrucomicrobiaceae bacterium]
MAIDYPALLERQIPPQTWDWNDRDFIVYALSLGLGGDPLDTRTLPFVYEDPLQDGALLKVVPTQPTVLAWVAEPTFTNLGVDPITALHGEQKIEIHRPMPYPVTVSVQGRVLDVYDKGVGRGAVVITEHVISDAADGVPIATLTTTCFGRSEGGCGGSAEPAPAPHAIPSRASDHIVRIDTRTDLALLYRLTGDRNPIHADPAIARAGGFDRPILHGLCSFGITCRAVLATYADFDPSRIASHQARFSSPVFPGETLTVDLWRDGNIVSFETRVAERNVTVIKNGKCVLRA